jgi:hypothetical protein
MKVSCWSRIPRDSSSRNLLRRRYVVCTQWRLKRRITAPLTLHYPPHTQQLYWLISRAAQTLFQVHGSWVSFVCSSESAVHASVRLLSHAITADFRSSRFQACVITDFPRG